MASRSQSCLTSKRRRRWCHTLFLPRTNIFIQRRIFKPRVHACWILTPLAASKSTTLPSFTPIMLFPFPTMPEFLCHVSIPISTKDRIFTGAWSLLHFIWCRVWIFMRLAVIISFHLFRCNWHWKLQIQKWGTQFEFGRKKVHAYWRTTPVMKYSKNQSSIIHFNICLNKWCMLCFFYCSDWFLVLLRPPHLKPMDAAAAICLFKTELDFSMLVILNNSVLDGVHHDANVYHMPCFLQSYWEIASWITNITYK